LAILISLAKPSSKILMHIFISYAKIDTRPLAERLFRELNAIDGMSAWMDESLEPASSWARQIEREIDRADYMVVLISPDVSRPETPTQPHSFVLNEIQRALESRPRTPILPVLAQRAPIPVELQTIQRIDATRNENEAVAEIIEHLCNKAGIESPAAQAKRLREEEAARQRREDEERRRTEQETARQQAEAAARERAAEQQRQAEIARREQAERAAGAQPVGAQYIAPLQTPSPSPAASSASRKRRIPLRGLLALAGLLVVGVVIFWGIPRIQVWQQSTLPTPTSALPTPTAAYGFRTVLRIELVRVPAGCFMMGSDTGFEDEKPVHQQCLDEFWIGRTEVTNGQYGSSGVRAGENRPRESVTWFEARDFCASRGLRLPTEAEWEYAARGPDNLIYPWGNEWNAAFAVWSENAISQTADVGSRPSGASWVGALDMAGNVNEWTNSLYMNYPYDPTDGREADTGDRVDMRRTLRGGSWVASDTWYLRAAARGGWLQTGEWDFFVGFRCALSS
jgi:formylglycine-generating enzyme required for sulfatase activity